MDPLSGVLGEAWGLYRAHAAHLLPIAFAVYLVIAVVAAVLAAFGGLAGAVLSGIVQFVAVALLQAVLVKTVQDVRDGRADMSLGETISAAMPSLGRVVVAAFFAGIAIWAGFVLFIVPGLYLLTIWSLIVPVIVIGRSSAFASFGRSFRLVRGFAWHVFFTYVLVFLVLIAVSIVIGLLLAGVPVLARNGISTVVSGTLIAPYLVLVVTLIYYRLFAAHGGAVPRQGSGPGPGPWAGPGQRW